MCKKLFFLSCVLVLSLAFTVRAEDLEVPSFAGCTQSGAAFWEFDVEYPEASDFLYFPDVTDPCVTIDDVECSGTGIIWNEGAQSVSVNENELNIYMTPPAGTGSSITIQCQVTYTGAEADVSTGLELWDGPRCEGGEFLDGLEAADLDFYQAVELEPGLWHTTSSHTFDVPAELVLVSAILFVTTEYGGSGSSDIHEVVLDAVIHDGTPPSGCPQTGRPFGGVRGVSNPSPLDGEAHVDPSTNLSFQAPGNALCLWEDDPNDPNDKPPDPNLKGPFEYDVYIGLEPNVLTMTQLADDYSPTNCNDVMVFDPCSGGDLSFGIWYYWRVDFNNLDPCDPNFYEGPYFSFRTLGTADVLNPADGATEVAPPVLLEWGPDAYAATCDVYLGTSFAAVESATTSSAEFIGNQAVSDANYNAGMLDLSRTYYWRIDEKNGSGTAIKGDVWSFTTGSYFVLEDFDRYASNSQLYDVWDDYWVNGTNSEIFLETDANFTLKENSLLFLYDSRKTIGKYPGSVADADIADMLIGSDWTISGIRSLLVNFRGTAGNSTTVNDRMWLELEDTSSNTGVVLYDGDMNNLAVEEWQEWNIDLAVYDACGVDLANVDKIHLGFAGDRIGQSVAGGTGQVYFDEIELHPRRCRAEFAGPKGDLDEDCVIDGYDLDVFSQYWLDTEYSVPPLPPDANMLELEYLFATDYSDTSGNSRHGQPSPTNTSVTGGALHIQAEGAYVKVPFGAGNPFDGSVDFSINIEYRASLPYSEGGVLMSNTDPTKPNDPNLHSMAIFLTGETTKAGDFRAAVYDNFYVGAAFAEAEVPDGAVWDAEWHDVAVTYDADGGLDANGLPTGLITAYLDSDYLESSVMDPNIPGIADDEVYIGLTLNTEFPEEDIGTSYFVGDINDVRVYSYPLSHGEVAYLAGKGEPTCYGVYEPANWVPSGLGPCEDPNNPDIINFLDYETLANNWLTGPWLWPDP